MTDALPLRERILTEVQLGESHFREFKSAWEGAPGKKIPRELKSIAQDICSTLVGFANADGGTLVVGVEDNGELTGLAKTDEKSLDYLSKCYIDGVHKQTPLKNVSVNKIAVDDIALLAFFVLKSSEYIHQTSDGKCLQRRDLETVPITVQDLHYSKMERISQDYDREFVEGASAVELDKSIIQTLSDQISKGMSVEKCLQHLRLAELGPGGLLLRRAALLLFAKDIIKWHPRLQIRILKVVGTEIKSGLEYNVASDEYVQGNVVEVIEKSWDALRPHLVQTKFSGSAKFESKVLYPELACREAVINAIAHRDYSQEGSGIEIFIFDDRMEVKSPGMLLSTISLDDIRSLTGVHQSRNTFIARTLRELGYMQEIGEGMKRIFDLMNASELEEPKIISERGAFSVVLGNKTQYSPEHVIWLENFEGLDLSREEKAIVVLGYGGKEIAASEIWEALGIVDTDRYRQVVESMQKKKILRSTKSKSSIMSISRARKINKRDVPRYAISVPTSRDKIGRLSEADNFDQNARIYVGNLPVQLSRGELLQQFRSAGFEVDIIFKKTIGRKGNYAFVQFDSSDQAQAAMAKLNGLVLADHAIVARPYIGKNG